MSEVVVNFSRPGRQFLPPPKLFRPDRMAEAVAEVIERSAPSGTRRKYVEKRFDMNRDDARRVVEGRASKAQLDKMFREGGWSFVLEVFALFFDRGIDQYLAQESRRYAQDAERLAAITRDLRLVAGARPRVGVGADLPLDRGAGPGAGRVGQGPDRSSV